MPEGCDISEHQGVLGPDWFGQWDFCIIRAFNENGYPDVRFQQNWANAKGRTLRGVYGWPIPGADNRALGQQLVAVAPDAEAGHWADVERSGRGLASAQDAEAYLKGIDSSGGWSGFYSNISELPRSEYLDAQPWWVANYSVNDGNRHAMNPPRPWMIHQYTSNPLDKNYAPNLDFLGGDMPLSLEDLQNVAKTMEAVDGKDLAGKHIDNLYLLGELIEIKKKLEIPVAGANVALLPSDLDAIADKVADKLAARLKD